MRSAACLVIGNEILSGKVEEKNVAVLARMLFALGIEFRRVVTCKDSIEIIAEELSALRKTHDLVFTSGGIGPTHDDITIEGVSASFDVPVDREPRMAAAIREYFGESCTEHHLRMANIPRGSSYVGETEPMYTTLRMGNVFVLPGVPSLFARKLEGLRSLLDTGARFYNRTVMLRGDEGDFAQALERVEQTHSSVAAGSYLAPDGADYDCRMTFDASSEADAEAALEAFLANIDRARVVRVATSGRA